MGIARIAKRKLKKLKYVYLVSKEAAWPMQKSNYEMNKVKKKYGISNYKYYSERLFEMSETGIIRYSIKKQGFRLNNERIMTFLSEFSGIPIAELKERRKKLSKINPNAAKKARTFMNYGFYECEEPAQIDKINSEYICLRKRSQHLKESIKCKLDNNMEIEKIIENEYHDHVKGVAKIISDAGVQYRKMQIQKCVPEISKDEAVIRYIAADMEVSREVLGFNDYEYLSYYFYNKEINERLEFISNSEREKYLNKLNSDSAKDILNSKCDTYDILKDYYGREAVKIEGKDSYVRFVEFINKHPVFVKKDNYESYGRGIELVDASNTENYRLLMKDIGGDERTLLIEEKIEPDEAIRKLNPDSVNTVRCVTFINDGEVFIQDCFMKVGRKGSFVDNGGFGGILVHINKDNGILDSDGIDEDGIIYERHPDHNYVFRGYQLPNWEKALELAKCVARSIDGAKYIGWDITCNLSGKWIVVEGNALTQFIGQQATIQRGCRKRFMRDVVAHSDISI